MFSPHQNIQVTKQAIKLVQSWQSRNIYSTLGSEARTLYRLVETLLNTIKPRELSDSEVENIRAKYISQGYSPTTAMRLTLAQVKSRQTQVQEWERNLVI